MRAGKRVYARDKLTKKYLKVGQYSYLLRYNPGKHLQKGIKVDHPDFHPAYTPAQMLKMGVFEGKYINDCKSEFPKSWYVRARISSKADPRMNYFGVKSRLSLGEWRRRKWIPVTQSRTDPDVRGWFQWYCRYWLGRRIDEIDLLQIKRWKSFKRHYAQVIKHAKNDLTKRKKQRQALLQWSWPCMD